MKINKKAVVLLVLVIAITATTAAYYYMKNTTYSSVQVVEKHGSIGTDNGHYIQYGDSVLKYSKDGVALFTQEGEQLWNQPCQMSNPIAEVSAGKEKASFVIADKEGTSIQVFRESGLRGEIQTPRPIEKVAVSEQGIVAVILQDGETPQILCYDAKGNILVKHVASLENTGYPMDISISPDGNVLLVSYLCIEGNVMSTKVVYYNFGEAGEDKPDHLVAQKEYQDIIVPTTAFISEKKSLLISDQSFIIYDGLEQPEEEKAIELEKEIKSVAYNEEYIVFVLKNEDTAAYELRIFGAGGVQLGSTMFEGEYSNIKIADDEIIMFATNRCAIFNEKGRCRYQGTLENSIISIIPIRGLNRYMMISTSGFEEVQLVK